MSSKSPMVTQAQGAGTSIKQGSAWISARMSERAVAQQVFSSDPKYKKYTQQVEKCLNSFDNVHEWADCIAFLKQLLKTFQSYLQFKEIPRKLIVAKRLSQCLNPALPTGVHQRALDVYSHILRVLGTEGLKRDLPLWSSGLFPFFEYAATSVKPMLLDLYDTYYLPLQSGLRPVMKSFILALLPGLEEETGEFFDKVLQLLDRISGTVSPSFFLQNVWLIMLTTPSARGTSLNFLSRRLPRLNANEDITSIVGRDIGLMIRAFAAALEDDNLLVRRGALDLLLQSIRVDSAAVKRAQPEDRTILMRAASGVVLRRDLSLNRRLYTWLLGTDEKSEQQIAFFKANALELLKSTLKDEMYSPSSDYSESRPFKIFISLLDKWEVGAALTDVLVYDAFKGLKQFVESNPDSSEDMIMTASSLYEAVEPHVIWKQLLSAFVVEILGDGKGFEAIHMALFMLRTFHVHDEEIQGLHLPVVFSAIMNVLNLHVRDDAARASSSTAREVLKLQEEILKQIPLSSLLQRPELTAGAQAVTETQSPYGFACTFYGIKIDERISTHNGSSNIPFASAFEDLISLTTTCGRNMLVSKKSLPSRDVLAQLLLILGNLVKKYEGKDDMRISISWDPAEWFSIVLGTFDLETANFTTIDRIVSLAVALHQTTGLEPMVSIDERSIMNRMIRKLFKYLHPACGVYHVRAVNLIWDLEASTNHPHAESIIARSMASPEAKNSHEAYESFGVLWRLTEDNLLPGFRFKVPMMIVLDTLKSDDPSLRRIGETWMRCSLKSYLRVLDPILHDLLDPLIRRTPHTAKVHGKELPGYLYERSFDQRYVNHILETLLAVVRFGGQGFAKTARTTAIRRTQHSGLLQRVESRTHAEASYLDVLVDVLLRFVQAEPKDAWMVSMQHYNSIIQSNAIDLLQVIVARGEIDNVSVDIIEAAVIGKLYFCVHGKRLDLQNKLLHILHSLISASTSNLDSPPTGNRNLRSSEGASDDYSTQEGPQADAKRTPPVNPLLIQTLVDGIAVLSNRPVLQHWLDFVLMAVPQFQPTLQVLVGPLNDCVCRQLRLALADVLRASKERSEVDDIASAATDAEFIMLLNALERLLQLSLANVDLSQQEDDNILTDKPMPENSGLLGYVSNVFGSDSVANPGEDLFTARSPGYRSLREGVQVLHSIWSTLAWSQPSSWSSKDDSLSMIYTRTRVRCRRVLEHLFRVYSAEVLESIVDCWGRDTAAKLQPDGDDDASFELIDILISSAQNAVHMICESISCRTSGSKKRIINPQLSDAVLFEFLEQYLQRLEGPLAIQVWGRYLQLVKETTGHSREFKPQIYPALRCLCVLAEKLIQTTAMDDKRVRKELQDSYTKLLDACVTFIGRSSDSGTWIRRGTKDSLTASTVNGRESPIPRVVSDSKLSEKINSNSPSTPEPSGGSELVFQINQFIGSTAIPNLRKFLIENDKIATACTSIVYYIVNPAMKGKSRPMDTDDSVVAIIRELVRIPAALKSWRTPVSDLINDGRVFNASSDSALKWKTIVRALFDTDKTAFPELLAKVATAPSANIFTNREYEMTLRSLNLRRLSYVLFAGDKNHFLTQLPSIQEKLVDILKNVTAPVVQAEVYLCIRVLLCRLSAHNLTSFWPVVLTELYRVFEQIIINVPSDGSEDLQVILSASKCLDLLLALQTEEFQIHQWIFITDTVDAVYRPDDWYPEAMMDQLSEIVGNLPVPEARDVLAVNEASTFSPLTESRKMRRPMLASLRQIDSIRDLIPFFSHVSISSYESVYASGGNIDWEAVERGLLDDMFDGRS